MNQFEKTQKKGQRTLIAILIIGVAVYLGFTPLFNLIKGGVAGAVVGSSFGAIFVIVLTMYLLNKQTEIEQESKKSERVFDEKVKLYKEILNITKEIIEDEIITANEVAKLPFVLMNLQMLGGDEAIDTYEKVFSKISEIYENHDAEEVSIDENEKLEIYKEMMKFTVQCRVDLGISDRIVNDELFQRAERTIEKANKVTKLNFSVEGEKVIAECEVTLNNIKHHLKRYESNKIRIEINGEEVKRGGVKPILREIIKEYNIVTNKTGTSPMGKEVIEYFISTQKK